MIIYRIKKIYERIKKNLRVDLARETKPMPHQEEITGRRKIRKKSDGDGAERRTPA